MEKASYVDLSSTLIAAASAEQAAMIRLLQRLVEAESPSSIPEAQAEVFSILSESLDSLGFEIKLIPGKFSGGQLLAVQKPVSTDRPRQLLIGHGDTIWPIGTIKSMPFIHQANKVKGPGVYDMKGGLTQLIFALKLLVKLNIETLAASVILINSDEEIGSQESRSTIERLAKDVERVFVLEPSLGIEGSLKTSRKGVGRFDLVVTGKAAHAGLEPEKGINAILEMSYQIQKLHALNDLAKGIAISVGRIEGGLQSNVVPPSCRVEIDVRVLTLADAGRVKEQILSLSPVIPGTTLHVEGDISRPPLEITPGNLELWQLAQELGRRMGLNLSSGAAGGGSDGNFTSKIAPTLDGLGSVGGGAHAQHEFIFVDKMIERTALLAFLLASPASKSR